MFTLRQRRIAPAGTGDIFTDAGISGAEVTGSGLIRVELDRAVMLLAVTNGADMSSAGYEELIAPEVTDLQFRYFDGKEWQTEWDSESLEKLPKAVEIHLIVDPEAAILSPEERAIRSTSNPGNAPSNVIYRQVVAIAAALDDPPEKPVEEETDGTTDSTTGSSTGSAWNLRTGSTGGAVPTP